MFTLVRIVNTFGKFTLYAAEESHIAKTQQKGDVYKLEILPELLGLNMFKYKFIGLSLL